MGQRRGRGVPEPARLKRAAFFDEVERACAAAGGSVQPMDGYLTVGFELTAVPSGLSDRARSLVEAFAPEHGVRRVRIDVRNRQWAAMVIEIATAIAATTPHDRVTPAQRDPGV